MPDLDLRLNDLLRPQIPPLSPGAAAITDARATVIRLRALVDQLEDERDNPHVLGRPRLRQKDQENWIVPLCTSSLSGRSHQAPGDGPHHDRLRLGHDHLHSFDHRRQEGQANFPSLTDADDSSILNDLHHMQSSPLVITPDASGRNEGRPGVQHQRGQVHDDDATPVPSSTSNGFSALALHFPLNGWLCPPPPCASEVDTSHMTRPAHQRTRPRLPGGRHLRPSDPARRRAQGAPVLIAALIVMSLTAIVLLVWRNPRTGRETEWDDPVPESVRERRK